MYKESETLETKSSFPVMEEIDNIIDEHGGWPGAFMAHKL